MSLQLSILENSNCQLIYDFLMNFLVKAVYKIKTHLG